MPKSNQCNIIALTGYPRVGKDTLAGYLQQQYPDKVIFTVAFADQLKTLHAEMLGISTLAEYNELLHNNIILDGVATRDGIAALGVSLKDIDPYVFINHVHTTTSFAISTGADLCLITDLRYPEEYHYVRRHKIPLVRIDQVTSTETVDKEAAWNKHIPGFQTDYVLNNNGTLSEYHEAIDTVPWFE